MRIQLVIKPTHEMNIIDSILAHLALCSQRKQERSPLLVDVGDSSQMAEFFEVVDILSVVLVVRAGGDWRGDAIPLLLAWVGGRECADHFGGKVEILGGRMPAESFVVRYDSREE